MGDKRLKVRKVASAVTILSEQYKDFMHQISKQKTAGKIVESIAYTWPITRTCDVF